MAREDHAHLLDALAYIDPATLDYQSWVECGMALHESGYDWQDWDDWSARDHGRYHEGECRAKWAGFGNGTDKVTSGSIIRLAEARGWRQPTMGAGVALDWGDVGAVQVGPDATSADMEPIDDTATEDMDPCRMLYDYLDVLFEDDDLVGYVCECWERDGELKPKRGLWDRTAGQLKRELSAKGATMDKVVGAWEEDAGAWIRFNPLDGKGCGNANVTEYRYALVESDVLEMDKQYPAIRDLHLPCAAVVSSGGKSVHAIVRVDAPDATEYAKRVRWLYDYCDRHGFVTDKQNKLAAEIQTQTTYYRNALKDLEEDKTLSTCEAHASTACQKCGINIIDSQTTGVLEGKLSKMNEEKASLEELIKVAEEKEKAVKQSYQEKDKFWKLAQKSQNYIEKINRLVSECQGKIDTSNRIIEDKKEELAKTMQYVNSCIVSSQWENDWQTSPEHFIQELESSKKQYQRKIDQRQEKQNKLKELTNLSEHVQTSMVAIETIMPEWKGWEGQTMMEIPHLLNATNDIRTNLQSTKDQLSQAEQRIAQTEKALKEFMDLHPEMTIEDINNLSHITPQEIKRIEETLQALRNDALSKHSIWQQKIKEQAEHAQKRPTLSQEDQIESLTGKVMELEQQMNQLGERKGAILQRLKQDDDDKRKLGQLIKDAETKKEDYQKWSRLNQLIGDAKGDKFRRIAQSYVLASLIHSANGYMKSLTDRYTLKVIPGSFVIMLEDAYQGFVTRAASTISGGESFLVSLSLALALSDIGQRLSVDTLFIDEGFGTLSGEPLQNAINTLHALHTQAGRHVGIISHVEELKERIPIQIQVNQEGSHSSSTIRIVPEYS